jgi:DNA processing protein
MLRAVAKQGLIISEVPPGSAPRRERFLLRNRLIAALGKATVVAEAAWRSGALRTAAVAGELMRGVGAVPGPVTSAASAGCHRLIREGVATLVCDAHDVLELVGPLQGSLISEGEARSGPLDGLAPAERVVVDSMPLRGGVSAERLTRSSGLDIRQTLTALGALERAGRVHRRNESWWRGPAPAEKA